MPNLLEYLRSTEEAVILHSPEGKVRRIMMLAISDVLGGYLQAVAVPMAKESYYAGNIDHSTISRLYDLLAEMKSRLRTDGGRWSRPVDMSKFSVKVTALHLPMENSELACKAIFVVPAESCQPGSSRIAIPYLDYDVKPGAVALPLKSRNLYSLKTPASSHIIVRFYMLARQCLADMSPKDTEIFNKQFNQWLSSKVIPHLYEDNWYPGFGSVMRIVETINETETTHLYKSPFVSNDTSLEKSLLENKACGIITGVKNMAKYNPYWLLFYAIVALVLLLLLLLCCLFMYKSRSNGYSMFGRKSSSGILNAVMSIYCGLKDKFDTNEDYRDTGYYGPPGVSHPPYDRYPPVTSETSSYVNSEDEEANLPST